MESKLCPVRRCVKAVIHPGMSRPLNHGWGGMDISMPGGVVRQEKGPF